MSENVTDLARTLEQQLMALARGASLECLVCGEFVMHAQRGVVFCPECGTQVEDQAATDAGADADHAAVAFMPQAG